MGWREVGIIAGGALGLLLTLHLGITHCGQPRARQMYSLYYSSSPRDLCFYSSGSNRPMKGAGASAKYLQIVHLRHVAI